MKGQWYSTVDGSDTKSGDLEFPWLLDKIGWRPLGKRGWKIVAYVWLSSGFLALAGSAFQARQLLATNMLPSLESAVNASVDRQCVLSGLKSRPFQTVRSGIRRAIFLPRAALPILT
jgi:hypothetical protein